MTDKDLSLGSPPESSRSFEVVCCLGGSGTNFHRNNIMNSQGFIQRGGGGSGIFPPQDFEIQYDVIIIIMYTMDIVQ